MPQSHRLAIVSDIHYASDAERTRQRLAFQGIRNPALRAAIRAHRHFIWLRDPFAHNHLLDRFIQDAATADSVVANGDFCCDTAYIGVADPAACDSAAQCLAKLRDRFGDRFFATLGDHELGKKKLGSDAGGLRLLSWQRTLDPLQLTPFWQATIGRYVLIGIVSTLAALPVFETESLPAEWDDWSQLRRHHLRQIESAFAQLDPRQRVLLFCHDPTALPFLWRLPAVQERLDQVEATVIGHLHSPAVFRASHLLAGMPRINVGHTLKRITTALRDARCWKSFRVVFCPSPPGIQLLKDGGYLTVELDPAATQPARFRRHSFPWR